MLHDTERQANLVRMRIQLANAFNPSGPVSHRDLFAGRSAQITQVMAVVGQVGQHVILFGERGVGKTSLASLTHEFWKDIVKDITTVIPIRYSCAPNDNFGSVWQSITELIMDHYASRGIMPPSGDTWAELLDLLKSKEATSHAVRRLFSVLQKRFILVIDEFDQLHDEATVQEFASTIKALSDYLIPTTLIVVGVADTVDELIKDYASIERALVQVKMPRMSTNELVSIIKQGYDRIDMKVDTVSLEEMGRLAQGLPHYAHRFGQEAGYAAADRGSDVVETPDVDAAVKQAIEKTNETIRAAYRKATTSPQKDAIFKQVLLACALTPGDDLGYFAAANVRGPLYQTTKKQYEIPQFIGHLKKFLTDERGSVLQADGAAWSRRYRFSNPLLRPYVVLKGIEDNMINKETVSRFNHPSENDGIANQPRLL